MDIRFFLILGFEANVLPAATIKVPVDFVFDFDQHCLVGALFFICLFRILATSP
jgi:hypothetical protein